MANDTLAYYQQLPYTRRVRLEEEDSGEAYFVAFVEELEGVEADGDTPEEAFYHLQEAFNDYIQAMLEWEEEIPEPEPWPGQDEAPMVDEVTSQGEGKTPEITVSEIEKAWASTVPWGGKQIPRWRTTEEMATS